MLYNVQVVSNFWGVDLKVILEGKDYKTAELYRVLLKDGSNIWSTLIDISRLKKILDFHFKDVFITNRFGKVSLS